jgi:hypothetical protein
VHSKETKTYQGYISVRDIIQVDEIKEELPIDVCLSRENQLIVCVKNKIFIMGQGLTSTYGPSHKWTVAM